MSSIMRWRSGLMGLSDIAKLLSRMGLNPTILRQGRALALSFRSRRPPAVPGRPYRASGLVLGREAAVQRGVDQTRQAIVAQKIGPQHSGGVVGEAAIIATSTRSLSAEG